MGIFEQLLGTELGMPARAVVALILVLALIAITVWLIRRFGDSRIVKSSAGRGRQQRLAVLDSTPVDARRRLVLVRRDNVEHLLLTGGPTDVVVESAIVRAAPLGAGGRAPGRAGSYDTAEDYESSLIPYQEPPYEELERPAPSRPTMPERAMPRPAQRPEPHYADMAQRLQEALRKPAHEQDFAEPQRPAPRAPEPRIEPRAEPRMAPASPRAPAPPPRAPAPPPRPPEPPRPAQAAPPPKSAVDVFGNLEDEMASLLRPGGKTQ